MGEEKKKKSESISILVLIKGENRCLWQAENLYLYNSKLDPCAKLLYTLQASAVSLDSNHIQIPG